MINAKIVNNLPMCGYCKNKNFSNIKEYKEIEMNDQKYVMFQVKCYSCNQDNRYLADIKIEGTARYEVNGKTTDITD